MILKSITLSNFRNFIKSTFYFNPFLTLVFGKNSVGKTNLLEGIYFVCRGVGIKEDKQEELLTMGKDSTEVRAVFGTADEKIETRIISKKTAVIEKTYQVNKIKKQRSDYTNYTPPIVIFAPQLINVIEGSPGLRRGFFDTILTMIDIEYKKRLTNYENGLRRRNKVLEQKKDIAQLKEELLFWDTYLIEQADYITQKRQEIVNYINDRPSVKSHTFRSQYDKNILSQQTLQDSFEKQLRYRTTPVGPQRDDYVIEKKKGDGFIDVAKFGSRSEERMAIFWLVLCELALYEEKLKRKPLLLLDDVFSELDLVNKAVIFETIKKYQTILTTTEREVIELVSSPHVVIKL